MKKLAIWVPILLLTVIVCIPIVMLSIFNYNHLWKLSADFENYADDFNAVKNYIEAEFPNESDKYLCVSSASSSHGRGLFDPDTKEYLQVPSDIISSIDTISREGFPDKDSTFDVIRIHEGRISFCIENGQYALVYSPNQKPSWVNSPNEDWEVFVKSIGEGWYHVTKNPG